jgi:hypothetical protein
MRLWNRGHPAVVALVLCLEASTMNAQEKLPRSLRGDDVVFMYATDAGTYKAYGATFLAWGGAHTRQRVEELRKLGIHPTGTMWCLTAGARLLHENEAIRDATVRDITGERIAVPWLFTTPTRAHQAGGDAPITRSFANISVTRSARPWPEALMVFTSTTTWARPRLLSMPADASATIA